MDAHAIASAAVPVLCIDTCSILDIMRDPTRDTVRPHDRQAAIDLVIAAEAGNLMCFIAEQVAIEFADHDQSVQDEAERSLRKMRAQIERINKLSAVYGAPGIANLAHLDDHVARARSVVGRLLVKLDKVIPGPSVPAKAFARMNAGIAPGRRGKESSKDCLVYETYLELVAALRGSGVASPIVFLSSNTNEYFTDSGILRAPIAVDFGKLSIDYAPNMSAAKHMLGL
jgi:hypothetical protein